MWIFTDKNEVMGVEYIVSCDEYACDMTDDIKKYFDVVGKVEYMGKWGPDIKKLEIDVVQNVKDTLEKLKTLARNYTLASEISGDIIYINAKTVKFNPEDLDRCVRAVAQDIEESKILY